jgi:hypothetical protein
VALIQRWSARKQKIAPSEQGRRFIGKPQPS